MAYEWLPRIVNASTSKVLYLPGPISTLSVAFRWKNESHEVPLRNNVDVFGVSRSGPTLTIGGKCQINPNSGIPICGPDAQTQALAAINGFLSSVPADGFRIFPFSGSELEYRKCYPVSLQHDLGDSEWTEFPYTVQFTLGNASLYLASSEVTSTYTPSASSVSNLIASI